ncbi:hypothetical protein CY34DRAFT_18581 [Suillus luteus UH-Slu-Lm8-n1]|uniref:Uncharacterized protein n=1 Tax=Suillus luteus UH-Slu-Lm8-n1 TaxID=930992 RepID=A0A0D0A4E9_9AGAM|nr:hypothetical protein CY34DRAFT_18581 [Suillus luteus UH-Slu-Lm8-n1]
MDGEKAERAESDEDESDDEDDKVVFAFSRCLNPPSWFPSNTNPSRGFPAIPSSKSKKPAVAFSVFLCTSVASCGLYLALVRTVIPARRRRRD